MITIIDYGMGNLRSVAKAFESVGSKVDVTGLPKRVQAASKCVLPGVGAFGDAMRELQERGLIEPLKEFIASGKPFFGICLGLQLLFDRSEESPDQSGLRIFKGSVNRFLPEEQELKVPHMGWNQIKAEKETCPLLKGIPEESYFYFVHSYYVAPSDVKVVATTTEYGSSFASMVWKDNLFATQFHPEKSQENGLKMLRNFQAL